MRRPPSSASTAWPSTSATRCATSGKRGIGVSPGAAEAHHDGGESPDDLVQPVDVRHLQGSRQSHGRPRGLPRR